MTRPGPEQVFLALGSNVGDRQRYLAAARKALAALPATRLVAASSIEETAPLGPPGQREYLNQMVLLETDLAPHDLLDACQQIEREAGRERRQRWGPRTLDLDIVFYGEREITDERLNVPHPELEHRDFWQREVAELRRHG